MRRPHGEAPVRTDIDDGNYDAEFLLGSYLDLELARSVDRNIRGRAASGGVLTEVCASLLETGEVDAVVHVGHAEDDPVTPRVVVSRTREELLARSGSVYCYVPPKEYLQIGKLVDLDRVAVICQPCLVPMIRHIQSRGWKANEKLEVSYVFSFFCGYNMTHEATRFLLRKAGVRTEDVEWIRYRHGEYPGGFAVKAKAGTSSGGGAGREVRFGKEAYEYLNLAFVRRGCYRCSLYMGDGADLSCGDAWLREHRNLTSILVRTEAGQKAMNAAMNAAAGRLERFELPEQTLLHMHLHNLVYKKYGNSLFLRALAAFFQDFLPPAMAPFRLLSWLSRQRRKRKIGVSLPRLTPIATPDATSDATISAATNALQEHDDA